MLTLYLPQRGLQPGRKQNENQTHKYPACKYFILLYITLSLLTLSISTTTIYAAWWLVSATLYMYVYIKLMLSTNISQNICHYYYSQQTPRISMYIYIYNKTCRHTYHKIGNVIVHFASQCEHFLKHLKQISFTCLKF